MPWLDLSADWFTCRSERAEPLTGTGDRPAGAFCEKQGNVLVTGQRNWRWHPTWPIRPSLYQRFDERYASFAGTHLNLERLRGISPDSPMKRRPIHSTDIEVTSLGLGTVKFGRNQE